MAGLFPARDGMGTLLHPTVSPQVQIVRKHILGQTVFPEGFPLPGPWIMPNPSRECMRLSRVVAASALLNSRRFEG